MPELRIYLQGQDKAAFTRQMPEMQGESYPGAGVSYRITAKGAGLKVQGTKGL